MSDVTLGVLQDLDPRDWNHHHYGLPQERWERLGIRSYWITGAGTGFGRALAVALASAGAQVFLSGRRREKLYESLEEMRSFGIDIGRSHVLPLDITSSDTIIVARSYVERHCGSLHGLINNAAVPQHGDSHWPLQEESREFWNHIFNVNVRAQWELSKLALPHMVKGGEIKILFVTSEAAWAFAQGFGQYNITKAALNGLGASMAKECAGRFPNLDIQINVLDPGEARTEMNQGSSKSPYTLASMALILLSHPKGGPNGKFFHRDGRHLQFGYSQPYDKALIGND
jgi:NAD(P)-dependent dehydrogenase (short-subunit alcohol dehydrogenase family)